MIVKSEIIGKKSEIIYNKHKFVGKIIDETKNTIILATKRGNKTILKKNATIIIDDHKMHGQKLTKRPEDRIKIK